MKDLKKYHKQIANKQTASDPEAILADYLTERGIDPDKLTDDEIFEITQDFATDHPEAIELIPTMTEKQVNNYVSQELAKIKS